MRKTLWIVFLVIILGFLFWYFIGLTFFPKEVQEEIMEGMTVKEGSFIAIDSIHKGSGTATIVQSGGTYYLNLENFQVTNGPDLYVYLSKNKDITDEDLLGEFEEISVLKGNSGNQMYGLTQSQAEFNSVVIWCKRFGVLFSSATLE